MQQQQQLHSQQHGNFWVHAACHWQRLAMLSQLHASRSQSKRAEVSSIKDRSRSCNFVLAATCNLFACMQAATYINSLPPLLVNRRRLKQAGLAAVLLQHASKKQRAEAAAVLQAAVNFQAQCRASWEQGNGSGGNGVLEPAAAGSPEVRALSDAMIAASEAAQEAASQLLLKLSGRQVGGSDPKSQTIHILNDCSCCFLVFRAVLHMIGDGIHDVPSACA